MRVAELTCLTRMVRIPDLDLELVKGQTVLISSEMASGSKDLALMRRINAVRVRWVRKPDLRAVEKRPPAPKPQQTVGPRPNIRLTPSPAPPVSPPASPEVDLEALAEKLAERLGPQVDRIVDAVRESGGQRVVVTGGLAPSSGELPGRMVPDETPAFIPETIIDKDAKADIQTKKSTSKGSGVTDAAAALKKARGGRKTKET